MFECSIFSPLFIGFFILAFIILMVGLLSYFIMKLTKRFCCKLIDEGFYLPY